MEEFSKKKKKFKQRKEYEKKPILKGHKSMRGQPEIYNELKKIVSFSITPTAHAGIKKISNERRISQSELIERIGRNLLTIAESICDLDKND